MSHYPLFLNLSGKDTLVVGAGTVGQRKISSLLMANPRALFIVDPCLVPENFLPQQQKTIVHQYARPFAPEDIKGKNLVFAATGNKQLDKQVAALCQTEGILCNIANSPEDSDFFVPAHFVCGGVSVALGTAGQSPALAAFLRKELEAWMGQRYCTLLTFLGRLRPRLLKYGLPAEENTQLFRVLVHSPLAEHLEHHRIREAEAELRHLLPEMLHPFLGELLHGL